MAADDRSYDPLHLTLDLLNPKITRLRHYCAVFQVIAISVFRFTVLTYTPTQHPRTHTHIYTLSDKVISIAASPYYIVGADLYRQHRALGWT